jgi:polysaccharide biosynthesis transport protein
LLRRPTPRQEQKGERLSVIDPPVVPDKPLSPNRPLLIAGGLAFGLAFGLFLILVMELFYRPIRDAVDIRNVTGNMPLVSIPTIDDVTASAAKGFDLSRLFSRFRRRRDLME